MADRKQKPKRERKGASWMDTYGDMVTLLLAFFVMLFASSKVNEEKWVQIVASFRGTPVGAIVEPIDPLNPTNGIASGDMIPQLNRRANRDAQGQSEGDQSPGQLEAKVQLDKLYDKLNTYVEQNDLQSAIGLERDGRLIFVTISEIVLFDSGKADIRDEHARLILKDIGDMIATYWDAIQLFRVEGHTDSDPIQTAQFKNNRFLSSARADEVLNFMQVNTPLPLDAPGENKFETVGMADTVPVAPNDTTQNKQKNRRVQFMIEGTYGT